MKGKTGQERRRKKALLRLQEQLVSKVKTEKKSVLTIPLSEKDIKRIEKEIGIIKGKVGV